MRRVLLPLSQGPEADLPTSPAGPLLYQCTDTPFRLYLYDGSTWRSVPTGSFTAVETPVEAAPTSGISFVSITGSLAARVDLVVTNQDTDQYTDGAVVGIQIVGAAGTLNGPVTVTNGGTLLSARMIGPHTAMIWARTATANPNVGRLTVNVVWNTAEDTYWQIVCPPWIGAAEETAAIPP